MTGLLEQTNVINLQSSELDRPIFRVFELKWLIETFKTGKLTLIRPRRWDDPFENLLLRSPVEIGGERGVFGFHEDLYGLCWTLQEKESDALWRIYSPNKGGVRVETTIRELFYSLYNSINEFPELSCFIGQVEYESSADILRAFASGEDYFQVDEPKEREIARSLLIKRLEFKYEEEVRLIYHNMTPSTDDLFSYPIEPNRLFKSILLDPRLSDACAADYADDLRRSGCILPTPRSDLYQIPKLIVRLPSSS